MPLRIASSRLRWRSFSVSDKRRSVPINSANLEILYRHSKTTRSLGGLRGLMFSVPRVKCTNRPKPIDLNDQSVVQYGRSHTGEAVMKKIFAISDASGKTAEGVVRAALTQFDDHDVEITRYGGIRSAGAGAVGDPGSQADGRDLSSTPWCPKSCAGRC